MQIQTLDLYFYLAALAFVVLTVLSAMASGSEVAFFSLKDKIFPELRDSENKKDNRIFRLLRNPKELLATILILNNVVNIAIIVLFTIIVNKYWDFSANRILAFVIQVILVTTYLVIFGEMMPKIFASHNNLSFARQMVIPMQLLVRIFRPFSSILVTSTSRIERKLSSKHPALSPDDITAAIEITSHVDNTPEDKKILKRIVSFSNVYARQIMVSRMDVLTYDADMPYSEILQDVGKNRFSRVPVFRDNPDNIIGILYIKDLLPHLQKGNDFKWTKLLHKPYFIPENKKIDDLLRDFQSRKVHMAIVVDEYGGFSGIITMEDVLEEIVGEIRDESDDAEEKFFKRLDEHTLLFDAKTPLTDFNRIMGLSDDHFEEQRGEAETLGGLITEILGKIPAQGDKIDLEQFTFIIESAEKKRIRQVKVIVRDEE